MIMEKFWEKKILELAIKVNELEKGLNGICEYLKDLDKEMLKKIDNWGVKNGK